MCAHPYKVHVAAAMLLLLGNTGTHGDPSWLLKDVI